MYVPSHFAEVRPEAVRRLIERSPLGALVTQGAAGLDANHIPFEWVDGESPHGSLRAHVARANPVWQEVRDGDAVLVLFRAADAYVSPNWYPSKHETHRQVPTWNYEVVNVHGTIRFVHDERFLRGLVGRLTRTHEATAGGEHRPWRMGDAPSDYLDAMLKAIVGVEIEVTRVVAKAKLSQNREERDRVGATEALRERGHHELAESMAKRSGA